VQTASANTQPLYPNANNIKHKNNFFTSKQAKKCSFREARIILKQQQNTTNNPTLTYSTVANQSTASVMLVEKSRNPDTITNTDLPTSSTRTTSKLKTCIERSRSRRSEANAL